MIISRTKRHSASEGKESLIRFVVYASSENSIPYRTSNLCFKLISTVLHKILNDFHQALNGTSTTVIFILGATSGRRPRRPGKRYGNILISEKIVRICITNIISRR